MMMGKIWRATILVCPVAAVLAIVGCQIQPAGAPCGDGLCLEGRICVMPSNPQLLGTDKLCVSPGGCGNGYIEADEECDDGEKNDDRGHCHKDCHLNHCGDGHLDRTEECDDGPNNGDDRDCRSDCIINRCGDGYVDTQGEHREACDGATQAAPHSGAAMPVETPSCNLDCTMPMCGDGKVNLAAGEECDDGPNNGDDRDCRDDCIINRCGDGFVNTKGARPEQCDDATRVTRGNRNVNPTMTATCNRDCTTPRCGDGIFNPQFTPLDAPGPEQCDDGGADSDGCSSTCQFERCGDGHLDPGEQCDVAPQDGHPCSATCREEFCGNGIVDPGEECDEGDNNGNDRDCRADCIINRCGDGFADTHGAHPEDCDGAPKVAIGDRSVSPTMTDICNINCTTPLCGDGILNPLYTLSGLGITEQCDDNNNLDGDGCSSTCQYERK